MSSSLQTIDQSLHVDVPRAQHQSFQIRVPRIIRTISRRFQCQAFHTDIPFSFGGGSNQSDRTRRVFTFHDPVQQTASSKSGNMFSSLYANLKMSRACLWKKRQGGEGMVEKETG
jgi:hypothetical protein